jgi:hypothetical protein
LLSASLSVAVANAHRFLSFAVSPAGNEYWLGSLSASGDPAAAACSLISELQNPFVNPTLTQSECIRVFAEDEQP